MMNFQNIKPVENYQFYLDLAFKRAREKGKKLKGYKLLGSRTEKSSYIEALKIRGVADTIASQMENILKSFPSFDKLPAFYKELVETTIDYRQLKKSLGALNWLRKKSQELSRNYQLKLKENRRFERINLLKREFLGRTSSLVKQVKKDFSVLEEARKIMKEYPAIDMSLPTALIVGFPNVGKTTLLYELTGSKADIDNYPFTTKGINVGYLMIGEKKVQFLDTPGTLNRFEKMNNIEKIAHLVIKHFADIIICIFDLTEEYSIDKQIQLYERLRNDFGKKIIIFLSKIDMIDKHTVADFIKKYDNIFTDIEELKRNIF